MRSPTLVAAATAATLFLPAVAAAATTGSVAGALGAKPPKGAEATVVATSLLDGSVVSASPITPKGSFKVTLPAGPYALSTSVVPKPGGGAVTTGVVPVSLKKGQKRTKLKVTTKKLKLRKGKTSSDAHAGRAVGTRAYVQELGQVTPGVTAFGIEEFTGGTGDWSHFTRGLSYLMTTDLIGATPCKTAVIATGRDREAALGEFALQKKYRRFFDPKTLTKRNFILPDLMVGGTAVTAADGRSTAVTVTIRDARTGQVVDTVSGTLTEDRVFDDAEQLSKAVGERVCRRPAAYELQLTTNGHGEFATHSSDGKLDSTLTALRSGGAPGEPPSAWSGVQSADWSGVTTATKTDCSYATGATGLTWNAQLSVVGDAQVKVDWNFGAGAMATLITTCPRDDGPPVVIPGQPGPALLGITPLSSTLPLSGGVIPLSGGFTSGTDGWTNAGQLVVRPIWSADAS